MQPRAAQWLRDAARAALPSRLATGSAAARLALVLAAVLAGAADAQSVAADPVDRLLYADAATYLDSPDPIARGEAALVLAASGDPKAYDAVSAVAKDDEVEARLRGILALGFLGVPGSEQLLEAVLAENGTRVQPDGIAAAFALGLLPPGQADAAVTRLLSRFLETNFKRQRDLLLGLLAALAGRTPTAQALVLHDLADNPSVRDPVLRAAVLAAFGRIPDAIASRSRSILADGSTPERCALLLALSGGAAEPPPDLVPTLESVCRRDRDVEVRAAALALLTRMRHLPALDIAARAIRSGDPVAVAQGTRTALQIGGAPMRRAIERQLAFLDDAAQAALLRNFIGPMTPEFQRSCEQLLGEAGSSLPLRTAAALALAQAGCNAVAPQFGALLLEQRDPDAMERLARAWLRLPGEPPELPVVTLEGDAAALLLDSDRLTALLVAGHPQASRLCVQRLQRATPGSAAAAVLRAIRLSRLPRVATAATGFLPEPLRHLLR